jgi:hypothetical protein
MIATHTPKMFNARLKTSAVASRIEGSIPDDLICSRTTDMRRECWAAPSNAADMKIWRETVARVDFGEVAQPGQRKISSKEHRTRVGSGSRVGAPL